MIRQTDWTEGFSRMVSRAIPHEIDRDMTAHAVQSGRAFCFEVFQGNHLAASFIISEMIDGLGKDICLIAMEGHRPHVMDEINDFLTLLAEQGGYEGIRAFSSKKGIYRAGKSRGWNPVKTIYRRPVNV